MHVALCSHFLQKVSEVIRLRTLKKTKDKTKLFLFLAPALIIYVVFMIIPMLGAVYFSLVEWNGIKGAALEFVGLKNYITAFNNPNFILSLKNMMRMVFFSVLFHTPIALLLAVAINNRYRGYRVFKAIFFRTDRISSDSSWLVMVFYLHAQWFNECNVDIAWTR